MRPGKSCKFSLQLVSKYYKGQKRPDGGGWTRTNERYTRAVLQTAVIAARLHRQKLWMPDSNRQIWMDI